MARGTTADPDDEVAASGGEREWLMTNGLGGYASGTISGLVTRRFHGLLIAALQPPRGRTMMLNQLREVIASEHARARLSAQPGPHEPGTRLAALREFRLELGMPVWTYELAGHIVERRIVMPHGHNTVHVTYEHVAGAGALRLELEPWIHFRPHESPPGAAIDREYALRARGGRYELADALAPELPALRLRWFGADARFVLDERRSVLYGPGTFHAELAVGWPVTLVASTEAWDAIDAVEPSRALAAERARRAQLVRLAHPALHTSVGSELVLAADQLVIRPAGRRQDAARARTDAGEPRTILAGYPWLTDRGRDAMISLEGLTLATGRLADAAAVLRTFAAHVQDGLIPAAFPEGATEALYDAADATLWFFHATDRYVAASGDEALLEQLLPTFAQILAHHVQGTRFGIGVDLGDGLLAQGAPGHALTWMDARDGDQLATPRRGKPVEINALWYNALCVMAGWVERVLGDREAVRRYAAMAARARVSFNARFWNERAGSLYDLVDGEGGDDGALRPNQLFAISLPHPVLDRERWAAVVDAVYTQLVTPYGLRTLARDHAGYQPRCSGDPRARLLACHQGAVWPWLIGPFADAWRLVHPDRLEELRPIASSIAQHLASECVGTVGQIFDAEPPYTARGSGAQAWSVAELVRLMVMLAPSPARRR